MDSFGHGQHTPTTIPPHNSSSAKVRRNKNSNTIKPSKEKINKATKFSCKNMALASSALILLCVMFHLLLTLIIIPVLYEIIRKSQCTHCKNIRFNALIRFRFTKVRKRKREHTTNHLVGNAFRIHVCMHKMCAYKRNR